MSLEGFVQAVGTVMGHSRDLFGGSVVAGAGMMPMSMPSPPIATAVSSAGLAASASNTESRGLAGLVSALGEHDLAAHSGLQSVQAVDGAGFEQIDAVIAATLGDITGLAPATIAPAGQLNLVSALARRLEQTWQTLTDGNACASTHAASCAQVAAAFNGLGNFPLGGVGATSPMGAVSPMGTPMGTMAPLVAMQTIPMMNAASMANQSALSGSPAQSAARQPSSNNVSQAVAHARNTTRYRNVNMVLHRAMRWVHRVPYVWGGGGPNGPTGGGFDCSGLVQHAYWPFYHLPRTADVQMHVGQLVSRANIRPGDLIFSNFAETSNGGAGHVQMAIGFGRNSPVVEAAHTGTLIRTGPMSSGTVVVKRIFRFN